MDAEALFVGRDGVGVIGAMHERQAVTRAQVARLETGHDVVLVIMAGGDKEIRVADLLLLELCHRGGVTVDHRRPLQQFDEFLAPVLATLDDAHVEVLPAFEHLRQHRAVLAAAEDHHFSLRAGPGLRIKQRQGRGKLVGVAKQRGDVARLQLVAGGGHDDFAAALDERHAHLAGQLQVEQGPPDGRGCRRNRTLEQFDATTREFLDHQAFGIADVLGQFHGGEPLDAEQVVDLEVRPVVEEPFVALQRPVHTGHRLAGAQRAAEGSGNQVHVAVAGEGEQQIAISRSRLGQSGHIRAVGAHHPGVELFVQFAGQHLIGLDDGDVVVPVGEIVGQMAAHFARACDDDVHDARKLSRRELATGLPPCKSNCWWPKRLVGQPGRPRRRFSARASTRRATAGGPTPDWAAPPPG